MTTSREPAGFQNPAVVSEQRVHAADLYSLISSPRTGRRRICRKLARGQVIAGVADAVAALDAAAACCIVVRRAGRRHLTEVSLSEDQHAVGEFGADG
jgi:hypothetical protein